MKNAIKTYGTGGSGSSSEGYCLLWLFMASAKGEFVMHSLA